MTQAQRQNRKLLILFLIALIFALLPWVVLAQDNEIKKEKFNLDKKMEDAIGYAQAVRVGNTIYVSGAVGWGSMPDAFKNVYKELEQSLKAYGASFKNVVKENVFTTDLDAFKKLLGQRIEIYAGDFPAATWVQVERLYSPELTLEIELIAELPSGK
jgi:2-iminobutanoate/2-iminopropanoate deaminase